MVDGWENLNTMKRYAETHNFEFKKFFPLAYFAMNYGEGWYMPSLNEARLFAKAYNGGNLSPKNKPARKDFEKIFKAHGGKRPGSWGDQGRFSIPCSTELGALSYYYIWINNDVNESIANKNNKNKSYNKPPCMTYRPIHKF